LNKGLKEAGGKYIARMDAEDLAYPDRLEQQFDFLEKHQSNGVLASQVNLKGYQQVQEGFRNFLEWSNNLLTPQDILLNRFVKSPLVHHSVMFRRRLAEPFGGYEKGDSRRIMSYGSGGSSMALRWQKLRRFCWNGMINQKG